jgi:threonyl-tRNA synthetase
MATQKIETIRHTLAHVMAAAVQELYPETKFGIGPVIENGFYYDFDSSHKFSEEDFVEIEKRMRKMIEAEIPVEQIHWDADEAIKQNRTAGQDYKVELLEEIKRGDRMAITEADIEKQKDGKISFYKVGKFMDLCRGPHVKNTSELPKDGFKLTRIAGAYWRGSEKNKMMTRLYAVAFETKKELANYLAFLEEAEKRDHRKFGKQFGLWTFSELIGSGLPLFTPKGALIRRLLTEYVEEMQIKAGYTQVWTPQIAKAELFKTSGHYDKYKDSMFLVHSNYSEEEFFLKPMNCPQHTQIYASEMHSYRDLPLRYTDFAMLYRDEKPGELNGLARVRSFSQDDCHIFCREDQVDAEVDVALTMTKKIMETFGFKYKYRLSTRDLEHPEKYLGNPETWDKVEKWAEKIMKRNKIEYFDGPGEAAFYAPKMDLIVTDALGREWQLSTVQIDYVMPERFDLTYIDSDGKEKHPVMLHRAIIGSPERFMMILLEHYAGALPTWLSPIQAMIIPISDNQKDFAKNIHEKLINAGIRAELNDANDTLNKRIRESEIQKIPYLLVVGDKEIAAEAVAVRQRGKGDIGQIKIDTFLEQIKEEVKNRS